MLVLKVKVKGSLSEIKALGDEASRLHCYSLHDLHWSESITHF